MSASHIRPDLSRMLRPRSVAVIGASDNSRWSQVTFGNLAGFDGQLHLVNRRGGTVHGRRAAPRCVDIGTEVDVGIVMVPRPAVLESLHDMVEAGIRHAVVLSSGFAELGGEGSAEQDRLGAFAADSGLAMLGPNSLGLINFLDDVPLWASPYVRNHAPGNIAALSHSGQIAFHVNRFARNQGLGLSHLVTTGNEARIDFTDLGLELLEDPRVRVLALYLETVRKPGGFMQLARRARELAKPLVVLKVGTNEVAARTAQAHTGALVGDDKAFSAFCAQHGVIRVPSIEDLVCTAGVLAHTGVLRAGGVGFVSNSGGVCGTAADTAGRHGVDLPQLSPGTAAALKDILPGYAATHNPLDLTGAAAADRSLFERGLRIMGAEPAFAALVCFADLPASRSDSDESLLAGLRHMGAGLREARVPALAMSCVGSTVTPQGFELIQEFGLPFVAGGLERGIAALGRAIWWSGRQREPADAGVADRLGSVAVEPLPARLSEHDAMRWLAAGGIPGVPSRLARDAGEAVAAAREFGAPVAVKLCSADVAHKSDIGGVVLGAHGDAEVAAAFEAVQRRLPAGAHVEGVLVAPMRSGGVELLVGIQRDPQWGLMLAVGLGGIWVEMLQDVALRQLPVTPDQARQMLLELKGAGLLLGRRGGEPADMPALGALLARIGDLALASGSSLEVLEINPLWVRGSRIEALDALIVTKEPE